MWLKDPKKRKSKSKTKKKKFRKLNKFRKKSKKKKSFKEKSFSFKKKSIIVKDEDGNSVIKVSDSWSNQALVNSSKYKKKYNTSIKENDKFWKREGKRITWIKPYTRIKDVKYSKDEVKIKWFYDGTLNVSANCIDRHLKKMETKLQLFG